MALPNHSRTAVVLALLVAGAALAGAAALPAAGATAQLDGDENGTLLETTEASLDGATNASVEGSTSASVEGATDATVDGTVDASTDGADATDLDDGNVTSLDDGNATDQGGANVSAETTADVETDAAPLANASLVGRADVAGGDLALDADVDGPAGVGVEASVAADASTDGAGAGAQSDGAAADDESADETGGDAAASGSSDGGPVPEDAGAGVAVGSLLLGAGLLARRGGTLALLSGSAGTSTLSTALGLLKAWGWRLAALAGYQRWDDSDPLEHEGRAAIYEHLEASPGDYLSEIAEETGVALSTLRYHLRILEFENLVTAVEVRGKRRFFPADVDPDALATALDDEATAAVLEALARDPDSVSGLADRLDRDPSTVSHHLQRLEEEGLVERERDGRSVVNRVADGVAAEVVAATDAPVASGAD